MGRHKKTTRRPPGSGSIYPDRRRGCFRGKLPDGRDERTGRVKYKRFKGKDYEDVARQMYAAAPPAPTITLLDWSKRWLASLDVREQSRDTYDVNLRMRIIPSLGGTPVAAITTFQINEESKKWGAACGPTTVAQTVSTLSACLKGAVEANLIARNPAELARKPTPSEPDFDLFSADEMRTILTAAASDPKLYPVALCCAVGCRKGEALALRAEDMDAATGRLSISRTVTRGKKGRPRSIGPPKSRHSKRELTVPAAARAALSSPPDTQSPRTLDSRWELLLKRLGIRHRGLHQLRHTVASHALASGVPLTNVARDLGDSPQTILRTYAHPQPGKGVCDAMESLFSVPEGSAKVAPKMKKHKKTGRKAGE